MKDSKPVGRYSLILEKEGVKYCYDFEKGSFREFDKKGPYKTKLSKIDAFTSYCDSKEQFLTLQGLSSGEFRKLTIKEVKQLYAYTNDIKRK